MSDELQTALQLTTQHGALDGHMLLILGVMVVMGVLGGVANYYLADKQADSGRRGWVKYPVFGVVAALTVPMFLNMISSTLLEGARTKPIDYYVFAGFCLLYVVASRRLFENMMERLMSQVEQVRRDVGHLKQQSREEPLVVPVRSEPDTPKMPDPREALSYNDIEILRVLLDGNCVYGNLASICDSTGLSRDLVSQRLTVMKAMGIIETRINEKNVLHWFVSARGKTLLSEILSGQEQKKTA